MDTRKLKLQFSLSTPKNQPLQRAADTPFRILVLGDFSGRNEPLSGRRPDGVDCDNLETVLARLAVDISLPEMRIRCERLNDFHPDHIFTVLNALAPARELRHRLAGRNTFPAAAEELRRRLNLPNIPTAAPTSTSIPTSEDSTALLARLLERPPGSAPSLGTTTATVVDNLIREIIRPHIVEKDPSQQGALIAAFDAVISEQIRAILHHPTFQAAEAAWRGLEFLVRNIETDEDLQLQVLDVSRASLAADLLDTEKLDQTVLYKLLYEEPVATPGGQPWSLIIGLFSFAATDEDAALLARLGTLAGLAGAGFIAKAAPSFLDDPEPSHDGWSTVRSMPSAAHIALALPRILLRLPYGASTDPVESFAFEENPPPVQASAYLWGNPALVCACMLAQSFRENGWDMTTGDALEFSGLPLHVYKTDGESAMTPCAEQWLNENAAENLLAAGLTPLLSVRGRDAVRLLRLQSIRQPLTALAGGWNR